MGKKSDQEHLDQLRDAIVANPEQKAGWLARYLGQDNKTITRSLPLLEERGDLLAEDDAGRLSWFGKRK
jgi:hypothetical protein